MRNKKKIAIVLTFIMLFTFIKIDYADAIAPAIPVGVYYVIAGLLTAAGLSVAVGDHEALQDACEKFWDYSQESQRTMIYKFYSDMVKNGNQPIPDYMWIYINEYLQKYYQDGINVINKAPEPIKVFNKDDMFISITTKNKELYFTVIGTNVYGIIGSYQSLRGTFNNVSDAVNALGNYRFYVNDILYNNDIKEYYYNIGIVDITIQQPWYPGSVENIYFSDLIGGYLPQEDYILNYDSGLGDFVNKSAPDGFVEDRRIAFEQEFLNTLDLQAALSSWTGQNVEDIRNNLDAYIAGTTVWQGEVQNDINEQTTTVVGALSSLWDLVNRGFGSIAQGLRWLLDKLVEIANFLNPAADTFFLRIALVPDVAVLNGFVESLNINFQEKFQITAAYEEFQSYKDTDHESEFEDIYVDLPIWGSQCICKGEFVNTAGQQFKSVVAAFLIMLTIIFCFKRIATIGSK